MSHVIISVVGAHSAAHNLIKKWQRFTHYTMPYTGI